MSKLVDVCKGALLLSAAGLFCVGGMVLWEVRQVTRLAQAEIVGLRQDVLLVVRETEKDLVKTANNTAQRVLTVVDKRAASIQGDLVSEVRELRGQLTPITAELTGVAKDTRKYMAKADSRIEPYTNCETNEMCLQALTTRTLFSANAAAADFSRSTYTINKAIPTITGDFSALVGEVKGSTATFNAGLPRIVGNVGEITQNVNRLVKPRWYDRLLGYGVNGALLYRAFNPAGLALR